jgi:hypothetical protein
VNSNKKTKTELYLMKKNKGVKTIDKQIDRLIQKPLLKQIEKGIRES